MKPPHICSTKLIDIDEKRIKTDPRAKHFIKQIYSKKFYRKVYTHFDGFNSANSIHISLNEALRIIPKKLIRMYFIGGFELTGIDIIPTISDTGILKLYVRYREDLYDFNKVSQYVESQLFYGFGENGFEIPYKSKTYTFFIR